MPHFFQSTLARPSGTGTWTYLGIPAEVSASFGIRGQIKAKGTIDGAPFRSTLLPDGDGGHYLVVNKALRDRIGKSAGDIVSVELEADEEPGEPLVPNDLQAALALNETASELFAEMPASHKKQYLSHIEGAKTAEARMRRIDKAVERIAGKRK